jgi:hypothetical protein
MVDHENITGDHEDITSDHEIIKGCVMRNLNGCHKTNVTISKMVQLIEFENNQHFFGTPFASMTALKRCGADSTKFLMKSSGI